MALITIICSWLIADIITGIVHWFEDKCLSNESKYTFIKSIIEDNNRHHKTPTSLCEQSIWFNINTSAAIAWPVALLLYICGAPALVWLPVFFASFANIIHRWAHEKSVNVPRIVRSLQHIGLFCSKKHHAGHHYVDGKVITRPQAQLRYCVMTNWLNPILDRLRLFKKMERAIEFINFLRWRL